MYYSTTDPRPFVAHGLSRGANRVAMKAAHSTARKEARAAIVAELDDIAATIAENAEADRDFEDYADLAAFLADEEPTFDEFVAEKGWDDLPDCWCRRCYLHNDPANCEWLAVRRTQELARAGIVNRAMSLAEAADLAVDHPAGWGTAMGWDDLHNWRFSDRPF